MPVTCCEVFAEIELSHIHVDGCFLSVHFQLCVSVWVYAEGAGALGGSDISFIEIELKADVISPAWVHSVSYKHLTLPTT